MIYTNLILFAFGLGGILLHNLIKLNDINRANDGIVNFGKYLKLERFSLLISAIVIGVAVMARNEIVQLEQVGKWLGFGFLTLGYMAQSIVVKFMGRAQKYLDDTTKKD